MAPLLRHAVAADRGFERMYRRHATDVYRYALAVLQNEADAEDVTQTTFLNAYRAIERGERPQTPHNWLIAIAHNVCRQRFRQLSRRPSEVGWDDDVADRVLEDDDVPSGQDIRRALGHLAFNQRAALVMRELEGRSYAEIAEMLGVSVSAVETLIFRARRALREQLEGSLTCSEAERAISKQLDDRLARAEKSALRAHLRECSDCATLARRQRAQRTAFHGLGLVPLPASLSSLLGGGATTGAVVAAKVAAVVAVAAGIGGAAYEGAANTHAGRHARHPAPVAVTLRSVAPGTAAAPRVTAPAKATHATKSVAVRARRAHPRGASVTPPREAPSRYLGADAGTAGRPRPRRFRNDRAHGEARPSASRRTRRRLTRSTTARDFAFGERRLCAWKRERRLVGARSGAGQQQGARRAPLQRSRQVARSGRRFSPAAASHVWDGTFVRRPGGTRLRPGAHLSPSKARPALVRA